MSARSLDHKTPYILFFVPEFSDDPDAPEGVGISIAMALVDSLKIKGVTLVRSNRFGVTRRGSNIFVLARSFRIQASDRAVQDILERALANIVTLLATLYVITVFGKPSCVVNRDGYRTFGSAILLRIFQVEQILWWGGDPFGLLGVRYKQSSVSSLASFIMQGVTLLLSRLSPTLVNIDHSAATTFVARSHKNQRVILDPVPYALFCQPHLPRMKSLNVGYIGRISQEKNLEQLIDACSGLSGLTLTLVGRSDSFDYLQELLLRASRKSVALVYRGPRPRSDLPRIYSKLDVVVLPSRTFEGVPSIIIESICSQTPVVAFRVGSIPKIVGRAGVLCNDSDGEEALRKAILAATEIPAEILASQRKEIIRLMQEAKSKWIDLVRVSLVESTN